MARNELIQALRKMKGKELISMVTAYDAVFSKFAEQAGIDLVLVGDSVANVLLGYENTKKISMNEMLHHVKAVARAKPRIPIIADMPVHSYDKPEIALKNAKKFLDAGAGGVKLEGTEFAESIKLLRKNKIEVMGHLGLLPQTAADYKVKGKNEEEAKKILEQAKSLDSLGVFSIVLECVPSSLAKEITEKVKAPTIGIGAGVECDGQVLVINDLIGLHASEFRPKFVKQYVNLAPQIMNALKEFRREVKAGEFPTKKESYE